MFSSIPREVFKHDILSYFHSPEDCVIQSSIGGDITKLKPINPYNGIIHSPKDDIFYGTYRPYYVNSNHIDLFNLYIEAIELVFKKRLVCSMNSILVNGIDIEYNVINPLYYMQLIIKSYDIMIFFNKNMLQFCYFRKEGKFIYYFKTDERGFLSLYNDNNDIIQSYLLF
jgi:hypothetical protein